MGVSETAKPLVRAQLPAAVNKPQDSSGIVGIQHAAGVRGRASAEECLSLSQGEATVDVRGS